MTQARRLRRRRASGLRTVALGNPCRADSGSDVFRQAHLPMLWRPVHPTRAEEFAHPAEAEFARILTRTGARWSYEPTTSVLSRRGDGVPLESFAPDFYLPDERLYIEITTMRQRLVTRKNGKLRRLRALHPAVGIKPLYRRDLQRLAMTHGRSDHHSTTMGAGAVIFSGEEIAGRVATLALEIRESWKNRGGEALRPLLLVHVDGGQSPFLIELSERLRGLAEAGDPEVRGFEPRFDGDVRGRDVLLVADIVSTGFTLARVRRALFRRGARRVEVCALFDRDGARVIGIPLRFVGFHAPDDLLAGHGLRLSPEFAHLPSVAILRCTAQEPTGSASTESATPFSG